MSRVVDAGGVPDLGVVLVTEHEFHDLALKVRDVQRDGEVMLRLGCDLALVISCTSLPYFFRPTSDCASAASGEESPGRPSSAASAAAVASRTRRSVSSRL